MSKKIERLRTVSGQEYAVGEADGVTKIVHNEAGFNGIMKGGPVYRVEMQAGHSRYIPVSAVEYVDDNGSEANRVVGG